MGNSETGDGDAADTSEYAASFELVDADGDGRISADELQRLMQVLGEDITEDQARQMVARVDSDGDGLISLQEFASFLSRGPGGAAGAGGTANPT